MISRYLVTTEMRVRETHNGETINVTFKPPTTTTTTDADAHIGTRIHLETLINK